MQRSRLKNIINKSKELDNISPFDKFKQSLPKELDYYKDSNNYRLESAWKAYGSPKDYNEALWQGLVQPIDEQNFKMPSIGYNEETDEYEYLNTGKENETVAKDIRVWDNDVIPFVKELKQGGFIRVFDDEKNCWKYSKTQVEVNQDNLEQFKQGGELNIIPEGALHVHKNNMELAKEGEVTPKGVPVVSVDDKGNITQQAEVEREEWTLSKSLTEDIERWYKKFYSDNTPNIEKEEIAIKCGKRVCEELLHNTDDRAGLIEKLEEKV